MKTLLGLYMVACAAVVVGVIVSLWPVRSRRRTAPPLLDRSARWLAKVVVRRATP